MEICAHGERYRNLLVGIFEFLTFDGNIAFPLSPVLYGLYGCQRKILRQHKWVNLVGLGVLWSVSYIKLIPTHEKLFAVGKSGRNANFNLIFLIWAVHQPSSLRQSGIQ